MDHNHNNKLPVFTAMQWTYIPVQFCSPDLSAENGFLTEKQLE